jgi:hypothetical protein
MFGSLGRAVKSFATPENLMLMSAAMEDGGPDNLINIQNMIQARRDRQAAMENMQQKQSAFANLLSQFKPDTQTPQLNDMISQLNDRQAQFGDAPAPMEKLKPASFDLTNPETIGAVSQYLQAGGGSGDVTALQSIFRPPAPKYEQFNPNQDIYAIDPVTGERKLVTSAMPKPPSAPPGMQWVNGELKPMPGYLEFQRQVNEARSRGSYAGRPAPVSRPQPVGIGRAGGTSKADAIAAALRARGVQVQ